MSNSQTSLNKYFLNKSLPTHSRILRCQTMNQHFYQSIFKVDGGLWPALHSSWGGKAGKVEISLSYKWFYFQARTTLIHRLLTPKHPHTHLYPVTVSWKSNAGNGQPVSGWWVVMVGGRRRNHEPRLWSGDLKCHLFKLLDHKERIHIHTYTYQANERKLDAEDRRKRSRAQRRSVKMFSE